jgi:Xaa-Pro aminopeptidase
MVLPAARQLRRSRDTELPYRPDSELFWATGTTEPGAVAVLGGEDAAELTLFVEDRDPEVELWSGPRLGPEAAQELFGADAAYPLSELRDRMPALLQTGDRVHVRLGADDRVDVLVLEALRTARARGQRRGSGPRGIVDPGEILDELRLVKDDHEIEQIRAATALTLQGHREGIAAARPGSGEWEVQAVVDAAFRRGGGSGPGFGTIVGAGANACVLHYVKNSGTIGGGALVLLDAGAELALYQGDVTRTFPASGRFKAEQRHLYELVEDARATAVATVRPGQTIDDVHRAATRVLVEGLIAIGILQGDPAELMEGPEHRVWLPHQTSHWLGLDVHDPGDYVRGGSSRELVPGMVFTVEPGLYVPAGAEGAAAPFAGIGVRIEDDVLVTPDGVENLTAALPTGAEDIAALVREHR